MLNRVWQLSLIGLMFLLTACQQPQAVTPPPPPPKVTVSPPVARHVVESDAYTGRLEAAESVEVRARVSGYLQSVHFADGAIVKKGALHFVIDPRPYQAELNRAKAALEQAIVRYERTQKDFARAQQLVKSRAISQEELDFFGRVRRSIEASAADVGAAEANRRDVIVSLLAEVARNYFALRGTQNRLAVARQNAENQRQTLALTMALLEGGRGTELDTSQAEAQWQSTLASIPPLETAMKRAMYRLGVLIGQPPTVLEPELSVPLPLPVLPTLVALGRSDDLLRRRPDIQVTERTLAVATARVGVETADLFPRVTLFGSVALQATSFTDLGKSGSDTFAVGPGIFWAAFDLGRVRARIRAADARTEAALAQYEQRVLLALEDTENALVDFSRQQVRRDLLRASAQASAKAQTLALQRYQLGVTDFLTVLDAERTLLDVEDRLADSETSTATAFVAIYKALGGGWDIAPERTYSKAP